MILVNALLVLGWIAVEWRMRESEKSMERSFPIPPLDPGRASTLVDALAAVSGVRDVRLNQAAGMAYLKVQAKDFDEPSVTKLIAGES